MRRLAEPADGQRIALLRGVNVGRAKRVAMADLRALVEGLGYADVRTLLNSGNVVFRAGGSGARDPAGRIERGLAKQLGVASRVTVLTGAELGAIVAENPLLSLATEPSRLLVAVWSRPEDRARLAPLAGQDWAPEAFALGQRAAYLWCCEGIITSRLARALERALGDGATSRNWATMLKLEAMTRDQREGR